MISLYECPAFEGTSAAEANLEGIDKLWVHQQAGVEYVWEDSVMATGSGGAHSGTWLQVEKCCAICAGVAYSGVLYPLAYDAEGTHPASCESFTVAASSASAGFYCTFSSTTDTQPFSAPAGKPGSALAHYGAPAPIMPSAPPPLPPPSPPPSPRPPNGYEIPADMLILPPDEYGLIIGHFPNRQRDCDPQHDPKTHDECKIAAASIGVAIKANYPHYLPYVSIATQFYGSEGWPSCFCKVRNARCDQLYWNMNWVEPALGERTGNPGNDQNCGGGSQVGSTVSPWCIVPLCRVAPGETPPPSPPRPPFPLVPPGETRIIGPYGHACPRFGRQNLYTANFWSGSGWIPETYANECIDAAHALGIYDMGGQPWTVSTIMDFRNGPWGW